MAWHPWDEDNTNSLEDVLATDDDPDPTQEDASDPPGWLIRRLSDPPQKSPFLGHAAGTLPLSMYHAARGRSGLIYPSGKGEKTHAPAR